MVKFEGEGKNRRTVFVHTTSRLAGIVCLLGVLLLVAFGQLFPFNTFMKLWYGFLALMALIFLWWVIRAHKIELYIENGVLHWADENATHDANRDRGSIPIELITGYRIVRHHSDYGVGPDFYDVVLRLQDGRVIELPPNVASQVACQNRQFYAHLLRYSPEVKKAEVEDRTF